MEFIILVALIAIIVPVVIWLLTWSVHISMCKDQNCPYGWGNFKQFMREFNKCGTWETKGWLSSLFGDNQKRYYLHADIVILDGKCMILKPISYLRYKMFMKSKCNELNYKNRSKIKW